MRAHDRPRPRELIATYPRGRGGQHDRRRGAGRGRRRSATQPVGEVTADITTAFSGGSYTDGVYAGGNRDDRASESTLGNLVANSLRDSLASDELGGADIGVVNPGGLRNELYYAPDGVITYAEANAVLPFVNNLWTTSRSRARSSRRCSSSSGRRTRTATVPRARTCSWACRTT